MESEEKSVEGGWGGEAEDGGGEILEDEERLTQVSISQSPPDEGLPSVRTERPSEDEEVSSLERVETEQS